MKLVPESLNEFYRRGDYSEEVEHVKDVLDIGDRKARDASRLRRFAEENGYDFEIDPKRGTLRVTVPMEFEIEHTHDTAGYGYWNRKPEDKKFSIDAVQYTVTYPETRDPYGVSWADEGTPISLRKRWMKEGKGMKQQLMGRLPNIDEAIRRIEKSIPKERKKAQR